MPYGTNVKFMMSPTASKAGKRSSVMKASQPGQSASVHTRTGTGGVVVEEAGTPTRAVTID